MNEYKRISFGPNLMFPTIMAKSKKKSKRHSFVKQYIKLLANNPDPTHNQVLLKHSPDDVVKGICNVAYNVSNGRVHLTPKHKALFKKHKQHIVQLIQPNKSLKVKRRILVQKGGSFWIPMLLSAGLSLLPTLLNTLKK